VKERSKRGTRLRRMIVVLAIGVAIGTMIMATPASAHFRSSIDHIWSHIKPKADARYLQNTVRVVKFGGTVALGGFDSEIVNCPAGYQAIGGGVDINQVAGGDIASSHPVRDGARALTLADGQHPAANGWYGAINNDSDSPSTAPYWVVVVCSK